VFISYSHVDRSWVESWLQPRLEKAGLSICLDRTQFELGVHIADNMERSIARSRKVLLVLTPGWILSGWTNFEAALSDRERIVPLVLQECELPARLSALTVADFVDPTRRDAELPRLVEAIKRPIAARREVPFILPQLDVPTFTGRSDEIARLEASLLAPCALLRRPHQSEPSERPENRSGARRRDRRHHRELPFSRDEG
jgi:hypothetical protein